MIYFQLFIFLVFIISSDSILAENNLDNSTIYLPFPDLPKEILEPNNSNKIFPDQTKGIQEELKSSSKSKTSPNLGNISKNNPSIENQKKIINNKTKSKINQESQITNNNATKELSLEEENPIPKENIKKEENESNFENLTEFKMNMERIRRIEKDNPQKAIEEYRALLKSFNQPYPTSIILISMAWNYYYRKDYLNSLNTCVRLLEDESLIHEKEYPTAFYIAYQIHGKPWEGKNSDFQKKYKSIFIKNYQNGRKNFQESFYKDFFLGE